MKIHEGLFDHMVLQRSRRNVSDAAFAGDCPACGAVTATVRSRGRALKGFDAVKAGSAKNGHFTGRLRGLPAGGPYDVDLTIENGSGPAEGVKVRDVLVGDVWLLGGQSNMQGVGLFKDGPKSHGEVRAFYMNDKWAVARDPIHNLWASVDQVHADLCGGSLPQRSPDCGVGPGVAFGQRMREITGVPQGLIACAHGGTSMSQWDPKLKHLGGRSLYGAMLRRFRKNGSKVAGLVWYQGCSDTGTEDFPLFTGRVKEFVRAFRRDFGDSGLPIAMVQIARVIGWGRETDAPWNSVQEQQRRLPESIPCCAVVPSIDLTLDDLIHISGRGQKRLGPRLADAMAALKGPRKAGPPPISLATVSVVDELGLGSVIVEFDNVAGKLHSGDRPSGFTVTGGDRPTSVVDVTLARNRAIVRTVHSVAALGKMSLHYGLGTDPYCNITDGADRSLPVFGPVSLDARSARRKQPSET